MCFCKHKINVCLTEKTRVMTQENILQDMLFHKMAKPFNRFILACNHQKQCNKFVYVYSVLYEKSQSVIS